MAVYCYRCPECGSREEIDAPFGKAPRTPICPTCRDGRMNRDFRAENKAIDAGVMFDAQHTWYDRVPKHLRGLGPNHKAVRDYQLSLSGEGPDWQPSAQSLKAPVD